MEEKIISGTFFSWSGIDGEKFIFLHLPTPISNYDAEPCGGILIVTDTNFIIVNILQVENLRGELGWLSTKIGDNLVFWKSEKNLRDRAALIQKLGTHPKYIG